LKKKGRKRLMILLLCFIKPTISSGLAPIELLISRAVLPKIILLKPLWMAWLVMS